MDKYSFSRNLGFFTGPLMLIIGIVVYQKDQMPSLGIFMMIMGLFRIGLTLYTYLLKKNSSQE